MLRYSTYLYRSKAYHQKDKDEYYDQCVFPQSLDQLVSLLENPTEKNLKSSRPISFKNILFGTSMKEITETFGKPRYAMENRYELAGYHILFYKEVIGEFEAITQFHFLDEQFFQGSYIFRDISNEEVDVINDTLQHKYFSEENRPVYNRSKLLCFVDEHDNRIELRNGIFLIITYLAGDKKVAEAIKKQLSAKTKGKYEKKTKKVKSIYDNL